MIDLRAIAACMVTSVLLAVSSAGFISVLQSFALGRCDPKLGCWGGVQVAAVFSGVVATVLALLVAAAMAGVLTIRGRAWTLKGFSVAGAISGALVGVLATWEAWSF